ncbi:LapA family protein [Mycolicibacterium phlei]|jgi:uncharacterized integral membrane protein
MSTDPSVPPAGNEPAPLDPIPVPPAPPGDELARPEVDKVRFTRAAALWSAVIAGFLVLVILLIFIAQNTVSTQFAFLGWRWDLPLGVAILGAAVGGGLITALAGMVRIIQLRRAAKKNYKAALR